MCAKSPSCLENDFSCFSTSSSYNIYNIYTLSSMMMPESWEEACAVVVPIKGWALHSLLVSSDWTTVGLFIKASSIGKWSQERKSKIDECRLMPMTMNSRSYILITCDPWAENHLYHLATFWSHLFFLFKNMNRQWIANLLIIEKVIKRICPISFHTSLEIGKYFKSKTTGGGIVYNSLCIQFEGNVR